MGEIIVLICFVNYLMLIIEIKIKSYLAVAEMLS